MGPTFIAYLRAGTSRRRNVASPGPQTGTTTCSSPGEMALRTFGRSERVHLGETDGRSPRFDSGSHQLPFTGTQHGRLKKLFVIGDQSRGELTRYDVKTDQFKPYLSGISAEGISFSSDGKWAAYGSYPDATLWRSRIDGSERLQLTFSPLRAYQPDWSPDGKSVAFMGTEPGKSWRVYIVSAGDPAHDFARRPKLW
jgi:WD40 repeat protein